MKNVDTEWTWERLLEKRVAGHRYEIWEGTLRVVTNTPASDTLTSDLHGDFWMHCKQRGLAAKVYHKGPAYRPPPAPPRVDSRSVYEPDLALVMLDRLLAADLTQPLPATPDLVGEVLSPGNTHEDLTVKLPRIRRDPALRELWIIDPQERSISVERREADGGLQRVAPEGDGSVVSPLTGFVLRPATIFADLL